jgi:cell division transport system permease protein
MFINLKRITKGGIVNFWRNGWVSFATVLIMVLTLFVVGSLVLGNIILTSVLSSLEDKVDITVYFTLEALEDDILAVRDSLETLGEVENVEYISRDEALERFRDRHQENALITQSLDELGENPLGASLNVRATDPSHYEAISNFLEANIFSGILDKINFRQNELIIERLSIILETSRNIGVATSILLASIAFMVAFNTIRMAIYTSREEIKIMKLVGASNWYTRGPFLVEGFLHGLFASTIATIAFFPITFWLGTKALVFFGGPKALFFFGGSDLFTYYSQHFLEFFLVLFLVGVVIGIISSSFAIRRYLRV